MTFTLTDTQKNFFHTFGYLALPRIFNQEEIAGITDNFEYAINTFGKGDKHDGSARTMFGAPAERTERLCALMDDERIVGILGGVLGDDFNYASGDGNYYSGDTGWHPDGNWGQLWSAKLAFYLDPVTRDTGCLRVIPGSHRPDHWIRTQGINPNQSMEQFGMEPRDFPGNVPLETNPGDLALFNHDTYHAAFGGSNRRRMFTMNLTRAAKTDEDFAMARQYLSHHSAGAGNHRTGGGMYMPLMVNTASDARWTHLQQLFDLHNDQFPHLAPEREGQGVVVPTG